MLNDEAVVDITSTALFSLKVFSTIVYIGGPPLIASQTEQIGTIFLACSEEIVYFILYKFYNDGKLCL